jgi:predicted transcriptional regulator
MVDEPLISEQSFQVLKRLPKEWWEYDAAVDGIANALHTSPAAVRGSIKHLVSRHLVERRIRQTLQPCVEIRKIGR